jgi:hypothetical protein
MSALNSVYNPWNDTEESVQDICSDISLRVAADRIMHPPSGSYEYQTATLGSTMLSKAFYDEHWAITPESRDGDKSSKRPDLIVEFAFKLTDNMQMQFANREDFDNYSGPMGFSLHLIYEAKGLKGNRFEQALAQVTDHQIPERYAEEQKCYVVVQRALKMGFFEYHKDIKELDRLDIQHFRGCVPLTLNYYDSEGDWRSFFPQEDYQLPPGILPLYFDQDRLRSVKDPTISAIREEAARMKIPCVFDYSLHKKEINFILARLRLDFARSI